MLRRLWLVFAQVVTATLAAIFVVSLVKPEWVPWRPPGTVVEIRETPASQATAPVAAAPGRAISFSDAARKAVVSVVNISATKQVRRRSPLLDDPVLRRFFGERFNIPETQLSLGSGVIVSREGFVLTNSHVVEGVTEIQVTLNDGRTVAGRIVGADPETDLAVVRIQAPGLTPITFGQSDQLKVGDVVLAIGDPFSVGQTVTMGIVSAIGREINAANAFASFIQTDAAINPGNSGGALVDAGGNLVGINTLIYSRSGGYQGIGFAIPVGLARRIMEEIIETGAVTRGWFGVEVANITPELAESLGLAGTRGAIVGGIERGSPADRAGIRLGDVILAVGGREVVDLNATLNAIADVPPGKTVPVRILRRNQELALTVTVGRRKPRAAAEE
ncbi:MAG: trypsin-like peptidase domain-containing protein [Burkholderiales bacterium]|nr:trypsin-like peptidase domain-containing protein [Burkholderiales bacterium]MBX3717940.1 trypsin-like peptidase domain-containing protein [Burkholderiales bacterium]MCL4689414.1 trypsin-like peptidase domain-containing protein [Burkholderiales bacterium]